MFSGEEAGWAIGAKDGRPKSQHGGVRVCLDRTLGDLPGQSSCLRPPCDRLQYCLVRQTLIPGDVWLRPWRKA